MKHTLFETTVKCRESLGARTDGVLNEQTINNDMDSNSRKCGCGDHRCIVYGYVVGLMDGRSSQNSPDPTEGPPVAFEHRPVGPVVSPVGDARQIVPNPHVGAGHHPSFDCTTMSEAIGPGPEGALSLAELSENKQEHEGRTILVKGKVIQAFPKIMGVNWFHVCDEPKGAFWSRQPASGYRRDIRSLCERTHWTATLRGPTTFSCGRCHLEGDAVQGGMSPINRQVLDL